MEDGDRASERFVDLTEGRPPVPECHCFQNQANTKGGQNGGQGISTNQRLQRRHLHEQTEDEQDEPCRDQGDPEIPGHL